MTPKVWTLIAAAVVFGSLSLYLNKDWFAKDNIQIIHRSRPARGRFARGNNRATAAVEPITFGFDRKLKLTSLKVIPLSDIETNKFPQPIWNLVSDSNSAPIKQFSYGMRIPGMRPAFKGVAPEPLQPGEVYRLFIQAGSLKAQHDFTPVPRVD
ncbi:MAG TPA: hypothetical protein VG146_16610 [Verrucomicrobiae bacterium]|nr:hypothetical protein [Verrucomicrobiae bacterium]